MKNKVVKFLIFNFIVIMFGGFLIAVNPQTVKATWTCGDSLVDSRDSNSYSTVLIGTQCWMAQNLNVGTRIHGTGNQGTSCSSIQKYCQTNLESNCDIYGGLYQWNQMMCGSTTAGTIGICPTGWHVPTHDEFTTLERAVCTSGSCVSDFPYDTVANGDRGTDEGTKLKPGGSSGFNGLFGGYRNNSTGDYNGLTVYAYFWSSSQQLPSYLAWSRGLYGPFFNKSVVSRITNDKDLGLSVRCLKDPNTAPTLASISASPTPIKGGSTITITPTGQGDADTNPLNFYCAENTAPTSATNVCLEGSASYASPYSTMTCTYAVATGDTTRTVYCRAFDGTAYSLEQTTTYTVDTTAPINIAISSISVDSPTQLTVTADTAIDSGSGLHTAPYYFSEITGNAGASSSTDYQSSATFVDTGLSPNTIYTYKVKAKDAVGNVSDYSFTQSKYTLAPMPSNLAVTSTTPTTVSLSVDALANYSQGGSGYYFYRSDDEANHNSGWIQINTWQDTDSSFPCNSVSYRVKYRNGNLVETATISVSAQPRGCGGSGIVGLSGSYTPPVAIITPPAEGVVMVSTDQLETDKLLALIETLKAKIQVILNSRNQSSQLTFPIQSPQPSQLTKTLSLGTIDPEIKILQEKLKQLGFFPVGLITNKRFGPATLKAVQDFQTANKIVKTTTYGYGIVGPKTRDFINSLVK